MTSSWLLRLSNKGFHGPIVTVEMTTTRKGDQVQLTYNIEMSVDVLLTDDKRKHAFTRLVAKSARALFGVSSVLTKKHPPRMRVTIIDGHGKSSIDIFAEHAEVEADETDE